jgi:CheY-like chemotaxis protein
MARNSAPPPPGDKPARAVPPAAGPGQKADTHGDVILVVDDDAAVRATTIMQLTRLGYAVREADDAPAALQIIESPARIDLLFTDVIMPSMDGKELAIQARLRRPDLPILFASGFPGTAQDGGIPFGADDLLLRKPYRKQELARAVRKVLAARR